jgi:hypothetical protein
MEFTSRDCGCQARHPIPQSAPCTQDALPGSKALRARVETGLRVGRTHFLVGLIENSWWRGELRLSSASGARLIEAFFVRLCFLTRGRFEVLISVSHVAERAIQDCHLVRVDSKLKTVQAYPMSISHQIL